ncbi:MAG: hypothetical protein RSE18_00020 [Acinetobacter sp.]
MVNELVFVRLYMQSTDGQTITYARGTQYGEIYRPSDDLESMLYEYRCWLLENNPRELALKEVPGLYPIPSLSWKLVDYLTMSYRATRFEGAGRETWAKLISKCAGGLSLVDETLALTQDEACLVNKYDVWSGSLEMDIPIDAAWSEFDMEEKVHGPDERYVGKIVMLEFETVEKRAVVAALKSMSGFSMMECKHALEINGWDITLADNWLRRGR